MIKNMKQESELRMHKCVEVLKTDLARLKTGRAHSSLIEHLKVPYYGNDVPLSQVSTITTSDPRTLTITPWEKNMVQSIEKAILAANLGLTPATSGTVIRLPIPPLSEERRKEIVRIARDEVEKTKVAIRNVRRDANQLAKDLEKKKAMTTDEVKLAENEIQKITDKHTQEADELLKKKEQEIMQV